MPEQGVGSYEFSNPNMFNGFSKRFKGAFSVGAMVKIPIWHWGGNYNKYRAAESDEVIFHVDTEHVAACGHAFAIHQRYIAVQRIQQVHIALGEFLLGLERHHHPVGGIHGVTNNKQLMISRQQVRKAGYQNSQAFAAYLPAIDFAGGYMYNQREISVIGSDYWMRCRMLVVERVCAASP